MVVDTVRGILSAIVLAMCGSHSVRVMLFREKGF